MSLQYLTGVRGVHHHDTLEEGGIVALTITRSFPPVYSMPGKSQAENGDGAPRFDLANALPRLNVI